MLDLDNIQPSECELCAQRRSKNKKEPLCDECNLRYEDYKLLKGEIENHRDYERAVAKAAGVSFYVIGDSPWSTPRETVLEAIKRHREAWEQTQMIKRLFEVTKRHDRPPLDSKTPEQWLEQSLGRIRELEKRVLSGLTPKEQEVLKKRFPKP